VGLGISVFAHRSDPKGWPNSHDPLSNSRPTTGDESHPRLHPEHGGRRDGLLEADMALGSRAEPCSTCPGPAIPHRGPLGRPRVMPAPSCGRPRPGWPGAEGKDTEGWLDRYRRIAAGHPRPGERERSPRPSRPTRSRVQPHGGFSRRTESTPTPELHHGLSLDRVVEDGRQTPRRRFPGAVGARPRSRRRSGQPPPRVLALGAGHPERGGQEGAA